MRFGVSRRAAWLVLHISLVLALAMLAQDGWPRQAAAAACGPRLAQSRDGSFSERDLWESGQRTVQFLSSLLELRKGLRMAAGIRHILGDEPVDEAPPSLLVL